MAAPAARGLQVGSALQAHYRGRASELVKAAGGSAAALVRLLLAACPGFRDTAIYHGRQVRACAEFLVLAVFRSGHKFCLVIQ